jgi:hypothetical protein
LGKTRVQLASDEKEILFNDNYRERIHDINLWHFHSSIFHSHIACQLHLMSLLSPLASLCMTAFDLAAHMNLFATVHLKYSSSSHGIELMMIAGGH